MTTSVSSKIALWRVPAPNIPASLLISWEGIKKRCHGRTWNPSHEPANSPKRSEISQVGLHIPASVSGSQGWGHGVGSLQAVQHAQGILHPLSEGQRPPFPLQGFQGEGGAPALAVYKRQEILSSLPTEDDLCAVMVEIDLGGRKPKG